MSFEASRARSQAQRANPFGLSSMREYRVRALLMGGRACVFYGAAQVSQDIDFALLAEPANLERLSGALREPPFEPGSFGRGHAFHFRCHAMGRETSTIF